MLAWLIALCWSGPLAAADFAVDSSTELVVITVTGDIAYGDDERFRALAVQHRRAAVVLASDGGNLDAALAIGRAIHVAGWSTAVADGDACASACALIWLAGTPRFAGPNASIGFHAAYREDGGRPSESGVANAFVGRYLGVLNLPDRAVEFATTAGPEGMRWLDLSSPGAEGIAFQLLPEAEGVGRARAAAPSPSTDEPEEYWLNGPWIVFRWPDSCSLSASYQREDGVDNESTLRVSVKSDGSTSLSIYNDKFRSVVNNRNYRFDLYFFGKGRSEAGWGTVRAVGIAGAQGGFLLDMNRDDLLTDLRRWETVVFTHPGTSDVVDRFPLEGSMAAVDQLRACLTTRPRILTDPFAR